MKKLFVLLICGALCAPTFAHQIKTAISTVLFNQRSGNLEIMHRFYLHDAEHAVHHVFDKNADIISDSKTQQRFAEYVSDRFSIEAEESKLPLLSVGFEIEGKFFWVYQEAPLPENVSELTVAHNALRDIWPDQINTVNIERQVSGERAVDTVTFRDAVELLKVEF
ncbi:MAG: DUF6702 family protein [Aestuariibacter sp.]